MVIGVFRAVPINAEKNLDLTVFVAFCYAVCSHNVVPWKLH